MEGSLVRGSFHSFIGLIARVFVLGFVLGLGLVFLSLFLGERVIFPCKL